MPAPTIRHVGTSNGTSTYKVADASLDGGEATVTVYLNDVLRFQRAYCSTCRKTECPHADRALRRTREGR